MSDDNNINNIRENKELYAMYRQEYIIMAE